VRRWLPFVLLSIALGAVGGAMAAEWLLPPATQASAR
jgi:hypothetical protein